MIKKTIKSFAVLAALAVAFVGFGSFSPNVNAEENIDSDKDGTLTLTPASDRQELKPGQVFNGHFNIVNTGAGPLDFNVYVKPITVDSSCTEQYEVENEYNIMANWTKFEQADFEDIQPGETAKVNFTITVPEDIPSGGQYVVMFAETGTKAEQAEGTSIKVGTRVGYKFFAD
ncbi:MAG: hypothetical protein LBM09_01920, partial [Candidatus Nomurabacteria bacterium]|nr:hypothetical protein [Candidatus Nomurabacteria bacterium]